MVNYNFDSRYEVEQSHRAHGGNCSVSGRLRVGGFCLAADLARGGHGFKHARHNLSGSRTGHVISRLCLEQFGVRQDDAELIVQSMEQYT